ncbi:MAG: PEP/pyruvate-binding domain-containing protein [Chloroflexi bacterium]|nr:PEP/pyruvate-binding domain-containing protein [Chloroflexota bacterium]
MAFVLWLDDPAVIASALGGKGASLARLYGAGFRVPAGFCVAASAYRAFVEHNALAEAIHAAISLPDLAIPKAAREAAALLSPPIERASLPASLEEAVRDAYGRLMQRCGVRAVVAVRSSALSEDAAGASSAGLYETYLNLRDIDAVLDGILRCYRSLWTARAIQYRAYKHIDSSREAMAVVVMQMVDSDVAGVAFTANPLTGDRSQTMINASWGLGEAIVSGRVTPDQFVLQKGSLSIVSHEVYAKEFEVRPDPEGGSGTVTINVPSERANAPALSRDALAELGRVCERIEDHYGLPMDIEWAFAGGELYVLQARPVTGLS